MDCTWTKSGLKNFSSEFDGIFNSKLSLLIFLTFIFYFFFTPQNLKSQIMEMFSMPWTHLPTTTSCCESVAPPKPAARRAPRAWHYHAWSRKGSKFPRASSESALPSSASLKLLEITKSHFITPPVLSGSLIQWICCIIELLVSCRKLSLCFLSLQTMR